MGKKSLAEQIAELSKPQNDFDIENSELADPFADNGSDGMSLGESDSELKNEHYVSMPKSKLRKQNDKLVMGKKYTGKVTDRKSLFDDNDEDDENEDDMDSNMESEESEESEDEVEDEDEDGENGQIDDEEQAGDDSDSGVSLRANSDSESEENSEQDGESSDESEEDADVKRGRIKAMMAKERGHIVSRLSQAATQDALKGYAILQQHKLFDAVIDSRLKIQKALANSNLLPVDDETLVAEDLQTEHTAKYLQKATEKCYDLLDAIFQLRSKLYTKEKVVTEPVERHPKKRSLDQYLESSHFYDDILNKYRASVLTKWLAKIQNSSGSSVMNASKFRALNQSAEQQVVNNLSDMDRLIKRTRLNRRQIKPLGYERYQKKHAKENENEEQEEEDADIPKASSQTRSLNVQELDLIFDDEDFYRVLLNDLVDKKIQSNDPTSGLQFALRGAASTKLKKNVDNKASKGRKLRYHVQEPIANFETPRNSLKWADDQIDEFFASLLGQKVNMKEDDEKEDSEDEEDEIMAGQDSIQLFG